MFMFNIVYKIIKEQFREIESMSEEDIRYSFLLGNITLVSSDVKIEMEWEWIPLLDFAYCLKEIKSNLKKNNSTKESFEFTENAETLEFIRKENELKISASFSSIIIMTDWDIFEKAVDDFHLNISIYIRSNISNKLSPILEKYL